MADYFDIPPSEKFVDDMSVMADKIPHLLSLKFKGDQSADFYRGMLAMANAMTPYFDPTDVESPVTSLLSQTGLIASRLIKEKS